MIIDLETALQNCVDWHADEAGGITPLKETAFKQLQFCVCFGRYRIPSSAPSLSDDCMPLAAYVSQMRSMG